MNTRIGALVLFTFLAVLTLLFAGCAGSSGGGGDANYYPGAQTAQTAGQVLFLPDGTSVLSDGTRITLSSEVIELNQNRPGILVIKSSGATKLRDMELQLVPRTNGRSSFQSQLVEISPEVYKIIIDPEGYGEGEVLFDVIAKNLPLINGQKASSDSGSVGVIDADVSADNMLKVAYMQLSATGSISSITGAGIKAANVIVFAFADPTTSSVNSGFLSTMQSIISQEAPKTINLISLGGEYAANLPPPATVVSNLTAQIASYNAQLTSGSISGVDLDLENGIPAETILALAQGFKSNGLFVSCAPQVYVSNGQNVDSANPTNLVLTSGTPLSNQSTYNPAIAGGYIDAIFAQTYNTGGWTIDNVQENSPQFLQAVAKALNNCTSSNASAYAGITSTTAIPLETYVVVGEPANAGAATNGNNIYGVKGAAYDQTAVLNTINPMIKGMISNSSQFPNFDGVMMWSLNNDYMPNGWSDIFATPGNFSSIIFEAGPPPVQQSFILQITNSNTSSSGTYPGASVTLVVNGLYLVFGTPSNNPVAPGAYQLWGTLASAQANPNVVDSSNLDSLLATANSFTTSSVMLNQYAPGNTNVWQPDTQVQITGGSNYTFQAGHSYNLIVNPQTGAGEIKLVN